MQSKLWQHRKRERILQAEEKKRHPLLVPTPTLLFFLQLLLFLTTTLLQVSLDCLQFLCGTLSRLHALMLWRVLLQSIRKFLKDEEIHHERKWCQVLRFHSYCFSSLFTPIWKGEANDDPIHLVSAASLNCQQTWIILSQEISFSPIFLPYQRWINKEVNQRLEDITQTQQPRPEPPRVALTWHTSKCKVHKLHWRCMLKHLTNGAFLPYMYISHRSWCSHNFVKNIEDV